MTKLSKMIKQKDYPMNEDIVISGIAGRFPEADTLDEFASKLFAGMFRVIGYLNICNNFVFNFRRGHGDCRRPSLARW